jgi:hypothetical protein
MLKGALSPEIGGNFIESLSSPEYYRYRLRSRAGMPFMNRELKKKEYATFDPQAYQLLDRITDNGSEGEKALRKIGEIKSRRSDLRQFLKDNKWPINRREILELEKAKITEAFKKPVSRWALGR